MTEAMTMISHHCSSSGVVTCGNASTALMTERSSGVIWMPRRLPMIDKTATAMVLFALFATFCGVWGVVSRRR